MTSVATRNGFETAASTAHERSVVGLTLAEALRYATRWRGKTVVVKLGGSVLDRAESATLEDVVLLQRAGVRIVLVHGGGPEITRMLDRLGHTASFVDGLRVTDEETMEVVEMVLTGRVNQRLVAAIERAGGRAAGISGKDGSLLVARPHPKASALGHVGEVERVEPEILTALIEAGFVPVISSVGVDEGGVSYNLNADLAAAALAVALEAQKLILLTDVDGVLRTEGGERRLVSELDAEAARGMLDTDQLAGGMIPKLEASLAAIQGGVESAHIVGTSDPDGLLIELLTDAGIGTMIRAEAPDGSAGVEPSHAPASADAPVSDTSPASEDAPSAFPDSESVLRGSAELLFGNYVRAPVSFSHGRGTHLWDLDGKRYLDFVGGIAVSSLGHAHPALAGAIREQAGRYLHVSNLYHIPEQVEAARLLTEASGLERAFFCNSGTEAVETAIKLARKWKRERGAEAPEIVTMEESFHGRTMGALAATGVERYRRDFEPLPPGFRTVPFNDLEAAAAAIGPETCAVLVEPIQGEGGVIPATPDYLRGLRKLTADSKVLLILDEVQTGIGRTGRWFGFQGYGIRPDIVTLAKGLGGGVPVGAVLATAEVAKTLVPGDHGSTFGGNPLACAAAGAVLRTIQKEKLLENVVEMGGRLVGGLTALALEGSIVREVRGQGLLIGLDLTVEAGPVAAECLRRGLLVNAVRPGTLRLSPPLTVCRAEVDEALAILKDVLAEWSEA